ncbi:arsenosugar biosynthesis radical SAM (seleno)protein ArsS [Ferruginibacter sp.]|uniref:arsenosugar biosynthesis radical SAM (seleno)protein ArsS n=1 Tax=Ferruginibacter sp. TaxID=1940288 RepID=UPI0019A56299|nr:arsenosugar biosynthesis radical SAM (seleno)protein ArsS [Ferruginibacter sp.]MBC7629122.1 arsenosugar biosynthesis radical SAM protein ArsS [Ferruginibacter sp.]
MESPNRSRPIRAAGGKSLKAQNSFLANAHEQIEIIENGQTGDFALVPFQQKLEQSHLYPLKPAQIEIFQVNIGKMCNQTCRHCHVDAGPDREEIMSKETMQQCIGVLKNNPQLKIVDLTGGAPEMNPNFRWFVEEIKKLDKQVIVRCNLTIILANKKYHDLPEFYKLHQIEVVSSLPFYTQDRTDKQRGNGVFEQSIKALQLLNEVGYGKENTGLILNLVYNAAGAFLPPSQPSLQKEYKQALMDRYGIAFNNLFTITNMPISRYLDYLLTSGNYETYMEKLVNAYNPVAAANVMCRNTISIGWDGYLYDCDFNQMLDLKVDIAATHISQFNIEGLNGRKIIIGQHCYGCTAGSGSSCGGAVA